MFFSFDGIDGAGKSTQIDLFAEWLRARGHDVLTCRDPGTTQLGEQVRELLLAHRGDMPMGARSEMLLYMAARAQLVDEVITPALAAGKLVVSDRFLLANVVYQGHAGGVDVPTVWQVGEVAMAGVKPDLVFLLDISPHEARQRLARTLDRMEARDRHYRARLRDGFLQEAKRFPQQIVVIDAARSVVEVHAAVCAAAERVLKT